MRVISEFDSPDGFKPQVENKIILLVSENQQTMLKKTLVFTPSPIGTTHTEEGKIARDNMKNTNRDGGSIATKTG